MMTYEQNIKVIIESIFAGYNDELIEDACKKICALNDSEKPKTGHWIPMGLVDANDNRNYECSECHHGDTHAKNQIVPYCWYCGAKMESEGKNEIDRCR